VTASPSGKAGVGNSEFPVRDLGVRKIVFSGKKTWQAGTPGVYSRFYAEVLGTVFTLIALTMILTQILQPTCVKVPLEGKDKNAVITELVNVLDENGLIQNKETVLDAVFTRERTRSTGIGSGIAIPHGKCNAVRELVMALGIASDPIDFDSVDRRPVSIVILLVSPADQTGPHIQALARISRLMLDEDFKKALENAQSAKAAYDLMSERESK
jgi:fructose-specific phosphotransferase system IIA component